MTALQSVALVLLLVLYPLSFAFVGTRVWEALDRRRANLRARAARTELALVPDPDVR